MNTPEPIKPVNPPPAAPSPSMSMGKLLALCLSGLLAILVLVFAAWDQGRINLLLALDVKGASRMQADIHVRDRSGVSQADLFVLYKTDADRGDALALWELGNRYQSGQGVGQNFKLARQSWEKAAKTGHPEVLMRYAEKCERGEGRVMSSSPLAAVLSLRQAASQGHAPAQAKLSLLLRDYSGRADGLLLRVADALSPEQMESIKSSPAVQKALAQDVDDSRKPALAKSAIDEVQSAIATRLLAEAYVWVSVQASGTSDDEVHALRDRLASSLGENDLQLAQEAVDRWRVSDSPGINTSPFAKVDNLVIVPEDGAPAKGSLAEALAKLSEVAAAASSDKHVGVRVPASVSSASPGTQSSPLAAGNQPYSWEQSRAVLLSATEIVADAAVRRNAWLSVEYGTAHSFESAAYTTASNFMMEAAVSVIALTQGDNAGVHPSVVQHLRDRAQNLRSRALCLRAIANVANQAASGAMQPASLQSTKEIELAKFNRLIGDSDTLLSGVMSQGRSAFGKDFDVPSQQAAFERAQAKAETDLRAALSRLDSQTCYNLIQGIKYEGWTFEFGELRELQFLRADVTGGLAAVQVRLSVQGNVSRAYRRFDNLTLYLTLGKKGPALVFIR